MFLKWNSMVSISYGTSVTTIKINTKYCFSDETIRNEDFIRYGFMVKKHTHINIGLQRKAVWYRRVVGKYVIHQV